MSMGFNVETYQMGKQNGGAGGSGTSQEVLDRLQKLEDNQMNIANDYYCDFTKAEYIDNFKSTVINTGHGIIPRQYKETWFDPFANDDNIDWDKCKSIAAYTNLIKLETPTTLYGEFYTLPIKLNPFVGFKFSANTKIPLTENFEGQQELKMGSLWFAQATDNYGRVWLFRSDVYKFEASPVFLTIYNPDMTIYKESTIPAANFFGTPTVISGNRGYSPCYNGVDIIFSEENLCIVGLMMMSSTKNGVIYDAVVNDESQYQYQKNIITFVDENGNAAVKYNYINSYMTNYSQWCAGIGEYHAYYQPFFPPRLSIQKNKVIMLTGLDARVFRYYNYDTSRCGKIILTPNTSLLDDVTVSTTYNHWYSYYYEANNTHWQEWCTRQASNSFKRNGISYNFITDYIIYSGSVGLSNMYLSELKVADGTNTFTTDNQIIPTGSLSGANNVYGFGGANGIHYSETYEYFYVFSNSQSSNILNVTRFEVDWTTKTGTAIQFKNPKTKSITLSGTTYWGSDWNTHYNERLKVIECKDRICLLYGSKNPINAKQQINFLSIDFDMEIIQPETQIHVSDGTAINNVVAFDMIVLEDKNIIIYTQGDRDDFNDTTADLNSHLFSSVLTTISSKLDFYYSTDTDLTWKQIDNGEQVLLSNVANDVRIKAVLQSNARYDSSPSISGIYIESWDNGMQQSRESQYYSNQIANMQNEGKAILTADQDLNDGFINWYVSYDGGLNYSAINLNEEFVYTHVDTPDFRIKAIISVTDSAVHLPIVRSYTLKTNHVVLHSDLEELQINLMKTNFKIDTLSNASRNGLFKMITDVFSDEIGIDKPKSDYIFYPLLGAVGGNYVVTVPQVINSGSVTVLITSSEILDTTAVNSHINYFASLDGGITYKEIYPNIKAQLSNTNSSTNTLIIKAVFYDDAKLSALGIAWD